jgi:hypothetical protein
MRAIKRYEIILVIQSLIETFPNSVGTEILSTGTGIITYNAQQTLELPLKRNLLHMVHIFNVCNEPNPDRDCRREPNEWNLFEVNLKFSLNYNVTEMASTGPVQFFAKNGTTDVMYREWFFCGESWLTVTNLNGMIVIGVENNATSYSVIANQLRPLDEDTITFKLAYFPNSASRFVSATSIMFFILAVLFS